MTQNDQKIQEQIPAWLLPGGRVDEVEFCRQFYMERGLSYVDGAFFGPEGRISEENLLRREIYGKLRQYLRCGLAKKVESILGALRMECPCKGLEQRAEDIFEIPVANGTYRMDLRQLSPLMHPTRYRLPVRYNPDAPRPERWLSFLSQLLYEEDIPTLQEFMGYCLIPSTLGQKMLLITGRGGEGKSRIGIVMKGLLGCNMNQGSLAKIEENRFARADLQHLLLMVDDDMKMDALKHTGYLKSIITAEIPMDLEKKGVQSYQGKLHVRFLAFGNDMLQSLHDRSHGFFRRQIILSTKDREPGRKDDPYIAMGFLQELEGILLWCIEGLERLTLQDFKFTMSRRARANLLESMRRGSNITDFMHSEGYILRDPEGSITSRKLYEAYRDWCLDNCHTPLSASTVWAFLAQNASDYGIHPSRGIPIGNGKYARGYVGIRSAGNF